jgi:hypothetical protein
MFEALLLQARGRASQTVPLTVSNFTTNDGFHFPKHHSQLWNGIFFVRGYGQAVF